MENVTEKDLVKFNQWTEARRRCYYRMEDAQHEKVPSIFEYRGVALRKSPMMRYLQGLFGILFCLSFLFAPSGVGSKILDSFVRESAASMLVLLFGYRMAQMARDNETDLFDRRYRRKILYPLLVSRGVPPLAAYLVYYALSVGRGRVTLSAMSIGTEFFTSPFSSLAIIGVVFVQFLFVFPFLWRILYSRNKRQVNKRMWLLVAVYVAYEIAAALYMVPAVLHHFFFGRYLLSFCLGMLLFIRRRKGLDLWEIVVSGAVGIIVPAGGYLLSLWDERYAAWLLGFRDMPFSAGAGTLLCFALTAPLLTRWRYFRLVKPSHSVVALPGKAYYNIIMTAAVVVGLDISPSILGTALEPKGLFLLVLCIAVGILWHCVTRSKRWRHFVEGIVTAEKGTIRALYWLKRKIVISWCKMRIRYYNRRLRTEQERR